MRLLSGVDDSTTWLAGHTRWPTQGSHLDNRNNQPMLVGKHLIGTHNGDITNADALFKLLNLPRFAEVDSEIIFRMADAALRDGRINLPAFAEHLALCRGLMSAVLASKLDPETVVVVKENKPLELRYHLEHQALLYASDPAHLDIVLSRETGWREITTAPMSLLTFRCDDLLGFESRPFTLAKSGGFVRYVEPKQKVRRPR